MAYIDQHSDLSGNFSSDRSVSDVYFRSGYISVQQQQYVCSKCRLDTCYENFNVKLQMCTPCLKQKIKNDIK